jgi:hypothetical protein
MGLQVPPRLWSIIVAEPGKQTQDQIVDCGHDLRRALQTDARVIFTQGYIAAIVQPIFDAPMTTDDGQQTLWSDCVALQTRDALTGFFVRYTRLRIGDAAHHLKDLRQMRPIRIAL